MATTLKKTYEQWFAEADRYCEAKAGLSLRDLPDMPYRDWYEGGRSAKAAAASALRNAREEMF